MAQYGKFESNKRFIENFAAKRLVFKANIYLENLAQLFVNKYMFLSPLLQVMILPEPFRKHT